MKQPMEALCKAYCKTGDYESLQQYLKSLFSPSADQQRWHILDLHYRFQQYIDKGQYVALQEAYATQPSVIRRNDSIQALAIKAAILSDQWSSIKDILIPLHNTPNPGPSQSWALCMSKSTTESRYTATLRSPQGP